MHMSLEVLVARLAVALLAVAAAIACAVLFRFAFLVA
jgi:hypothetical protein